MRMPTVELGDVLPTCHGVWEVAPFDECLVDCLAVEVDGGTLEDALGNQESIKFR